MASKLHRQGIMPEEALVWEPASKGGAQAAHAPRDAGPKASHSPSPEFEKRARELEAQWKEKTQAAYQRGLREGDAAGRQQAAAQIQPVLEKMARAIEEIATFKPRLRHESEADVVTLAIAIARRILYREIATDPDALMGLVRSALDKLDSREVRRVRVSPQDAPAIQQRLTGMPFKVEIAADAKLQRGSAIFETNQGTLDASIETQLGEIERGFADLMKRSE